MAAEVQSELDDEFKALDDKIEQLLAAASARMTAHIKNDKLIPKLPKLSNNVSFTKPYIVKAGGIAKADQDRLIPQEMKQIGEIRRVEDPVQVKLDGAKALKATAGVEWYNLPKTNLTPELKKDLQLLHMRNVLDPKQHYKRQSKKFKVPEFSHIGTVVEGPTEFYSSRVAKKDRSNSLAGGLLSNTSKTKFKAKYGEVQKGKTSGKKAHYKALQAKRNKP